MKGFKGVTVAAGMLAMLAVGCTKERPYKTVYKDEDTQTSKALLTEAGKGTIPAGAEYPDDLYLYFPSTVNVSRTTTASRPHWAGDAKLVKIKYTKDAIKVVEVEKDPRFQGNELNNAPIFTIPIKHVDFKCAEDADGKCTNQESENVDIPWEKKRYFDVLVNQMQIEEVNFFPETLRNLFFPCNNVVGQEFTHYDAQKDGLNIEIDRTYQSNIMCAGNIENLQDLTFRVRYHYSLIKLNSLVAKGYKPLLYPKGEENVFGFFDTTIQTLDPDNNNTVTGETRFVNRWRPGRTVTYRLSENFNKPEYAKIKQATIDSFETMNASLAKAGAGITLKIAEPDANIREGDLRDSALILEEDPLATGLIGYGPTVANPLTGEIVYGRTVMYLGTMKKYLKNSYDELVKEKMTAKGMKINGVAPLVEASIGTAGENTSMAFSQDFYNRMVKIAGLDAVKMRVEGSTAVGQSALASTGTADSHKHADGTVHATSSKIDMRDISKIAKLAQDSRAVTRSVSDTRGKLDAFMKEHCLYDAELFNFNGAIEDEIDKVIDEVGLKPWAELTAAEQEKVIDALLPFVWTPTFIHEMGHNLGLRHNFGASEDKANYYTRAELDAMGIKRDYNYSSVMDYPYKTTNELHIMGKYDVAALQFGYAEKVERADGSVVTVQEQRQTPAALKEYQFCTDEHVGLNPNCNTFDEGTNLSEIAAHHVSAYKDLYLRRNFRNNRKNFSLYQDANYVGQIGSIMDSLRAGFERYEDIKRSFGLADNDAVWNDVEFLKDLKNSVKISAQFLTEVIAQPDVLCAAADAKKPNVIVGVVPLKNLAPRGAVTCFDEENVQINPAFVIVAQAGKHFQSMKDPRSKNPYLDQIDVRGTWIDKLLAIETMVGRKTGIRSFDDFTDNMLDVADLAPIVRGSLESVVRDQVVSNVEFVTREGQTFSAQIPLQFFDANEATNTHLIVEPLDENVAARFGLSDKVSLHEEMITMLKRNLPSREQLNDTASLLNTVKVMTQLPNDGRPANQFANVQVGNDRFLAHKTSTLAVETMTNFRDVSLLETIAPERLAEIAALKAAGTPLTNATEAEKKAYAMDTATLEKYMAQGFQSSTYYAQMIRRMAQ